MSDPEAIAAFRAQDDSGFDGCSECGMPAEYHNGGACPILCSQCEGRGVILYPPWEPVRCPYCAGVGVVEEPEVAA
jgi:hypothetical protein